MRLLDRIKVAAAAPQGDAMRAGLVDMFETWAGAKPKEYLEDDFRSYVQQGYKANGVIFAVILARASLFSEARFTFRDKTTHEQFRTPALDILDTPWPNGTTGELLWRMEQDASLGGQGYIYRAASDRLQRLRPDWMEIITDTKSVLGYVYTPGGPNKQGGNGQLLDVSEVCHWSPIPDPRANFRGMSWLTPVLGEVMSDSAMTRHKQLFFERAATPNMLIKVENKLDVESRERLRTELSLRHEGLENAYRTLILDGGADATIIGSTLQAMSFDVIQAAGENRIASAGNTPGIVVGLKEGLQAATYSNFQQAMRRFADIFAFPQWRSVCAALQKLVDVPEGAELWFDTADIRALSESEADRADIILKKSEAAVNLVRAGFAGEAVAKVVETGEGFENMPHTGEIYFPGAQAYAEPGQEPDAVPGDVKVKATPSKNGKIPQPVGNG